jgi:hypothetical protein
VFTVHLKIMLLQLVGVSAVAVRWRFQRDLLNVSFRQFVVSVLELNSLKVTSFG